MSSNKKVGWMITQARVINREVSYLRWYLEKINLILKEQSNVQSKLMH
ncbi:hypothetical protein [Clostridium gasigenes]|uniref:Uncharacterized protein n=1 Tax=Clostridium gasigenes TaxID=94869 RepID=A0A7X0VPP1_9CLOT|nr:hypothetical protein [Clostridium gasigenes]MBB6713133.1 hypothetical protein [Clostridium gasigenes]